MTHESSPRSTTAKDLKFDSEPAINLKIADNEDNLAATVRYNDEKDISRGDVINIVLANQGNTIGQATVKHVESVPVRQAIALIEMHDARYGIATSHHLNAKLKEYYDDEIKQDTYVKVILLDPDLEHQTLGVEPEMSDEP